MRAPPDAQRRPGQGGVRILGADRLVGHGTRPSSLAAARYRRDQADRAAGMLELLDRACRCAQAGIDGRMDMTTAVVELGHIARLAEAIVLAGEVQRGRTA